ACAAATSDGFPPPTPGNDQHQLRTRGPLFICCPWSTIQPLPTLAVDPTERAAITGILSTCPNINVEVTLAR
ncbi:hypothetical protein ACTWQO_45785, partial [Streptomyces sp. 4N124]